MRVLFLLILIVPNFSSSFSSGIDYEHRSLVKALEKVNDNSEIVELKIPEAIELKLNEEGKYFQVSGNNAEENVAYVYVGRVNSCRSGGCSAPGVEVNTSFEYFDYFILYDVNGVIEQVKVFNYQATHGQEITLKAWLRQFQDYSVSKDLKVGKQVDGIAGATVSVYAITEDIRQKSALLKEIIEVQFSRK